MALSRYTLSLASKISNSLLADYRAWEESCEQDRREGHTPHYCEHGTSRWTDYDNICGGCEDGVTMADGVERRTYALDSAKRRVEKVTEITTHLAALRDLGVRFTVEQLDPVYAEINRLLTVE